MKEISAKQLRDAQKLLCIDTLTFENIVHIGAITMEFTGEPTHGTPLPLHFGLNQFAYVYHFVLQPDKKREAFLCSPSRSWTT